MRGDLDVNQRPVFLAMFPDTVGFGVRRCRCGALQQGGDVFWRTNVLDRERQKFFPRVAIVPDGGMIRVQDGESLQVINPHGMRITVEKQMVSLLGPAKRFLRPLALCHVVKNNNTALKCAIRTFERSAVNTQQSAFGHLWVTDEKLYSVNILAPYR